MDNNIIISRFDKTDLSTEDVHHLVDEAWQRWFEAGLDSVWFHLTEEQFARTVNSRMAKDVVSLAASSLWRLRLRGVGLPAVCLRRRQLLPLRMAILTCRVPPLPPLPGPSAGTSTMATASSAISVGRRITIRSTSFVSSSFRRASIISAIPSTAAPSSAASASSPPMPSPV